MLKRDYADEKMPMIMASNAQMLSALSSKSGAGFDRAFRENIIAHHEEAVKMEGQAGRGAEGDGRHAETRLCR